MLSILDRKYGHWQSVKTGESINSQGQPIPWYTYPAIEYLEQLDLSDKAVFEWGAGNSSLYWAGVAETVVSIEDDPTWFHKVKERMEENGVRNLKICLIEDRQEYVDVIALADRKYDIIAIDGSHRYECALIAPNYLAEGGLIILDNADWLPKSAKALRKAGLLQVDMSGYAPVAKYTYTTSLFFHPNFRVKSKEDRQPRPSVAAISVPKHFLYQEPR